MSKEEGTVLIVGGRGEFGQFLQQDILPALGCDRIATIERDTPHDERFSLIAQARHIVVATPLSSYTQIACKVVSQCRNIQCPATLWLIPSVQTPVWRAVRTSLQTLGNSYISAVCGHPMYGPNGFRANEPEASTFQNVVTATYEGADHPLGMELAQIFDAFSGTLNIRTNDIFSPEEHDRFTAYSQGLSYCVGRLMFLRPKLNELLREHLPDLHHSFHANHGLILDFITINTYMSQVVETFDEAWHETAQSTYGDVLQAFARADIALNRGHDPVISTKWYEKLRAVSYQFFNA